MKPWRANAPDGLDRDQDGKMISMQNNILTFTATRPDFVLGAPSCPTCRSGMRFVKATPTAFTPGLVDVSYVCGECGREAKRTIRGI